MASVEDMASNEYLDLLSECDKLYAWVERICAELDEREEKYRLVRQRIEELDRIYTVHPSWIQDPPRCHESQSSQNVSSQRKQRAQYEILGLLNGQKVSAGPDTGASLNTINTGFAKKNGYRIHTKSHQRILINLPNGRKVWSKGIVKLEWSFVDDPQKKYHRIFHAVSSLPRNVLLGLPFLKETETLGKNIHRILRSQQSANEPIQFCKQSTAGSSLLFVDGTLNGTSTRALADSGCEGNLISYPHAQRLGVTLRDDPSDQETLVFADGRRERTHGKAMLPWAFHGDASERLVEFDVVDTCEYDVVLGQELLFDSGAFVEREACFVEVLQVPSADDRAPGVFARHQLNVIGRLLFKLKRRKEALTPAQQRERVLTEELGRRAKADQRILGMREGPEKEAARQQEQAARQRWIDAPRPTGLSAYQASQPTSQGGSQASQASSRASQANSQASQNSSQASQTSF